MLNLREYGYINEKFNTVLEAKLDIMIHSYIHLFRFDERRIFILLDNGTNARDFYRMYK